MTPALCPSLDEPWVCAEGFRRVNTWSCCSQQHLMTPQHGCHWAAMLCCALKARKVSFCVQCKNWWKCVFFLLLLLLVLCQHHLSWSPTVSLSLPSVLMWISSSITCDSSKCSPCADWDFCPQHRSAHLSFETGPALFSSAAPLSLEHIPYCTGFNFHLVTYLSENFKWAWSLNLVRVFLLIFYTVSCVRKYSDIIIGRLFLRQSGCQDFFFSPL